MSRVPIASLSALNPPPAHWLMAVLKGYFDDSGSEGDSNCPAFSFAGYVGSVESWNRLEPEWQSALAAHGVPHLHMKEFGKPKSALNRLSDPARMKLFTDLFAVIRTANLSGFGAVIRFADLARFNRERGRNLSPVPLAIYGCLNAIYEAHHDDTVEAIIDRIDRATAQIAIAEEYAGSHKHDDVSSNITLLPLKGELTFRSVVSMQVADLIAWHAYKYNKDRPLAPGNPPPRRLDFDALLKVAPINGHVWDYNLLCWIDDIRGGVWAYESRQ